MSDNPPAPERGDSSAPSDAAPAPETATPERPAEYLAEVGFEELALSPEIRRALVDRGYTHPTPVQAQAFDPVMQGKDLIVRSKTGTGKTAAFGLPLLEKMDPEDKAVRALVLCPTRELALQVAAELSDLGKHKGVRVSAIYGGASMKEQEDALESGSPIVVGTPGRIWDHIRRKNLKLQGCRHVVLDEADEMLNQGFYEEVTRILDQLPKDRQVLLFSATVPPEIQNLISQYTTSPEMLMLSGDVLTVDHIHHVRYDVTDAYPKPRNLVYVLEMEEPDNAIVFCNTRDDTALVTAVLNRNGFDAELLNGDLPQKERERVMAKVKRGEVAFMVATDIAARGIDISDLQYVINYSLPEDPAVYLHRVGRTGRIGKKGTALNLISGRELGTFTVLEKKYGIRFEKREMPSPEDAMRMWTERHVREIQSAAAGSVYEGYLGLAGELKQRSDADDAIAYLLKYFFGHLRMEKLKAAGAAEIAPGPAPARSTRERDRSRGDRPRREDRGERGERSERGERPERGERGERAERGERHERGERSGREERSGGRERRERRERPPRRDRPEESAPVAAEPSSPGEVRLWMNLGSAEGLDAAGITAALEALGAPSGKLLRLDVRPTYSYGFVAEEDAAAFEKLNGQQRGEKALRLERARRR